MKIKKWLHLESKVLTLQKRPIHLAIALDTLFFPCQVIDCADIGIEKIAKEPMIKIAKIILSTCSLGISNLTLFDPRGVYPFLFCSQKQVSCFCI